jgi:phosphatidate cytidylyltransferase
MLLRILTAAVLLPVVVVLVWWGPAGLLAAVAAFVAILALTEFFHLGERLGLRAFRLWTAVCAAFLFYAQYSLGGVRSHSLGAGLTIVGSSASRAIPVDAVLLIFLWGAAGCALASRRALREILPAISVSSAGLLFIALPFSYLVRINEIQVVGRQLVLFTLCFIWAGDILAYFVGRFFGRVAMAPAISPKKTWEGAVANCFASLLVAIAFAHWMQWDMARMLVIAGVGNIAGQMGDLVESAYKRGASVKDSSSLLPGHGGMLDRIDSLILASPAVWLLLGLWSLR